MPAWNKAGAWRRAAVKKLDKIDMEKFKAPRNLKKLVQEALQKELLHIRWDAAIQAIVAAAAERGGAGHHDRPA